METSIRNVEDVDSRIRLEVKKRSNCGCLIDESFLLDCAGARSCREACTD